MSKDYTPQLRQLMQSRELTSFQALYEVGFSRQQIKNLRQGQIQRWRLDSLQKLAQVLDISLEALLEHFGVAIASPGPSRSDQLQVQQSQDHAEIQALRQEYQRLADQLAQQQQTLRQAWQAESLQILEPWLIQWPKAADVARQNPQLPAVKLLPLLRPLENLLQHWQIEPIGQIGAEVTYDPQRHQLQNGTGSPGTSVQVDYVGYQQGDRLLHRAKVSLISPST